MVKKNGFLTAVGLDLETLTFWEINLGFPLNPQQVTLFAGGSTATKMWYFFRLPGQKKVTYEVTREFPHMGLSFLEATFLGWFQSETARNIEAILQRSPKTHSTACNVPFWACQLTNMPISC